ncbi:FN3 associated domain-containing protein [Saccharicrinis sp. FJH62]|uniref:FN3 associated domain-containing protein n=1 Tax=Saccharicrinis sp. FJH62 TaxID=3344657 RepID=UPI0035D3F78C
MKKKFYVEGRLWTALIIVLFMLSGFGVNAQSGVIISEFMAVNDNTLADEDGDYSDWIELYNAGETAVSLTGWYLTDKADNLAKWKFPVITIQPDEYLVVFASEKDKTDPAGTLHTNFKLSGSGEFLALVKSDGTSIAFSYGDLYPGQRSDVSYGIYLGQQTFFKDPTPGSVNVLTDQVLAPEFSVKRGFYDAPFEVELSVADNALQIYYSKDGTRPNKTDGILYTGPVQISTTTPLSAVAVNSENVSSDVITNTYFFIDDIVKQPAQPAGYPDHWGPMKFSSDFAPSDYEMDPEICESSEYKDLMDDALLDIPTISIVTNIRYIFGLASETFDHDKDGIYMYTGNTSLGSIGIDWERSASVEFIDPKTGQEFQINCGLHLHGGNSRVPENSPKHGFRIAFRSSYGPSKLNFRVFDEGSATNEFNNLVFRAGYNYSWLKNNPTQRLNAQYLQDPYAKNIQLKMNQEAAHERFAHLYINGLYWGLYNISEKINNDFMEAYLGGKEEDYDVVKDHNGVVDGSRSVFNQLMSLAGSGFSSDANYQKLINDELLDLKNFTDYMLMNYYIGNGDWDGNNWLAGRSRVNPKKGFRFFAWDAETSMTDLNTNKVTMVDGEPTKLFDALKKNDEFKLLVADRIHKYFFNDGALTPEVTASTYAELADEIDLAIIGESARWGDYRKDVQPSDNDKILYTRNDHWLVKKNEFTNDYFPDRSTIVFNQLRNAGLYPNVAAPEFNYYDGTYQQAIDLEMTSTTGQIYYTTDDTDPREAYTGGVASNAKVYSSAVVINSKQTVRARAKSGSTWSALTKADYKFDGATAMEDVVANAITKAGAFPNPFRGYTTLFYDLEQAGNVTVSIFSVDGREIEQVFNGYQTRGAYRVRWNAPVELSGVFIFRVSSEKGSFTGKIIKE